MFIVNEADYHAMTNKIERMESTIMRLTRDKSRLTDKIEDLTRKIETYKTRENECKKLVTDNQNLRREAISSLNEARAEVRRLKAANDSLVDLIINILIEQSDDDVDDVDYDERSLKEQDYQKAIDKMVNDMSHDKKIVYASLANIFDEIVKAMKE